MTFKQYIFYLIFVLLIFFTITLCTYANNDIDISIYDSISNKENAVIEVIYKEKEYKLIVPKRDLEKKYNIIEQFIMNIKGE